MKLKKILLVIGILFLCWPSAHGEEWAIRGARALGMGGAQVADPKGTLTTYWNPAGLAFKENVSNGSTKGDSDAGSYFEILVGDVSAEVVVTGGLMKDAFDLKDLVGTINGGVSSLQSRLNSLSINQTDLNTLLKLMEFISRFQGNRDKGAYVNLTASALDIRLGSFALTSQVTVYGGVNPVIQLGTNNVLSTNANPFGVGSTIFGTAFNPATDVPKTAAGQNLANSLNTLGGASLTLAQANALVAFAEKAGVNVADPTLQSVLSSAVQNTSSGTGGSFDLNQTGIQIKGMALSELRGSMGMMLLPNIAIGANIKLMRGVVFNRFIALKDAGQLNNIMTQIKNDLNQQNKETFQVSVDVGALVKLGMFQAGLTIRNLIPTQYQSTGKDFRLEPQARAGVAVVFGGWITGTLDLDVNPNTSFASKNFKSYLVNAGVEIVPLDLGFLSIAGRFGISKNLNISSENEVYHLGVGAQLFLLKVDAAIALDSTAISTGNISMNMKNKSAKDIPDRVGFAITVGLAFSF